MKWDARNTYNKKGDLEDSILLDDGNIFKNLKLLPHLEKEEM